MKKKIKRLRNEMRKNNIDGFIFSSKVNKRYFLGSTCSNDWILITNNKCFLITNTNFKMKKVDLENIQIINTNGNFEMTIKDLAIKENILELGFEEKYVTFEVYNKLSYALEEDDDYSNLTHLMPTKNIIENIRDKNIEFI